MIPEVGDPFTQAEILQTLQDVDKTLTDYFAALPAEQFFVHPPGVWSAAENLDHLVLAVKMLLRGLSLPRLAIRARFGKPANPSRRYAVICAVYRASLANGGAAGGAVLPDVPDQPADPQAIQTELVEKWSKTAHALLAAIESWKEADLDKHQLPHPLLGLMTVREVLLWTIYHNLHHLDDTQRLFVNPA